VPLTDYQRDVLRLLASNRSPDSYVAGGTIVNQGDATPRFSNDIDLFHDPDASVVACAAVDSTTLEAHGYRVTRLLDGRSFIRATVKRDARTVLIDWATDSAFRFFPVVADTEIGYRLHSIDSATNKCLALAGRTEVRDVIDVLTLHDSTLHLGAIVWAACGKDPGFTPDLLLDLVARNARLTPDLLAREALREPIDPKQLKLRWLDALAEARALIRTLPAAELGCVYVSAAGVVGRVPQAGDHARAGSVRGVVPVVVQVRGRITEDDSESVRQPMSGSAERQNM